MTTLSGLIERVEAAEEGSRELDAAIQRALGSGSTEHWFADVNGKWVSDDHAPLYSTSLDAALTLVPEGLEWELFGYDAKRDPRFGRFQARIKLLRYEEDPEELGPQGISDGYSPALALVAASLRALQDKDHPHA